MLPMLCHSEIFNMNYSALDVALDGTVSVVWGTCEVGHV